MTVKILTLSAALALSVTATRCGTYIPEVSDSARPELPRHPVDLTCVSDGKVTRFFNARYHAPVIDNAGKVVSTEILHKNGEHTLFPGRCKAVPSKQKAAPEAEPQEKEEKKKNDGPRPRVYSDYALVPV